jgi:hypothetical protein
MIRPRVVCFAFALAVAVSATFFAPGSHPRADDSKYRVFCADGKIEVEQRTLEQEKNARGSNVCVLGEYDYLSDAEKRAEGLGGKGASCNCN